MVVIISKVAKRKVDKGLPTLLHYGPLRKRGLLICPKDQVFSSVQDSIRENGWLSPMLASYVGSMATMAKIIEAAVQGPKEKKFKSKAHKGPFSFMLSISWIS